MAPVMVASSDTNKAERTIVKCRLLVGESATAAQCLYKDESRQ